MYIISLKRNMALNITSDIGIPRRQVTFQFGDFFFFFFCILFNIILTQNHQFIKTNICFIILAIKLTILLVCIIKKHDHGSLLLNIPFLGRHKQHLPFLLQSQQQIEVLFPQISWKNQWAHWVYLYNNEWGSQTEACVTSEWPDRKVYTKHG